MIKRILSLMLALVALLSVVSCGGTPAATTDPTVTDTPSTDPVTEPTTTGIYDTLKNDIYLDDMEFNVHLSGNSVHTPDDFTVAESGSVMDDAIFEKNALMAEKYGVETYLYDGVHPATAGAKLIATEWLKVFNEVK